ncbi:MAG TPA: CDP-diacylglycerol--glycerol-3-phosphate 3-phosphatidyltransferase [Terriglobales bacterium]|nr:CDP-diacylglycerol--glycerol-3-phosphate 3-phosphatidyltransferase [Terriglobales bacterium]
MNLPNYITLSRIAMVPLLIWILSSSRFAAGAHGERELLASAVFILASITDGLDGYLARSRGQITTMGMLLDPLADKLLIASAFITLVQFNPHIVAAWMAVVIIGREFLVSGLRSIAAQQGFTIDASDWGKVKMVVQIVVVAICILEHAWHTIPLGRIFIPVNTLAVVGIWFMVTLSLVGAVDYFVAFWSKIDRQVTRRRRRLILSRRKRAADPLPPENRNVLPT